MGRECVSETELKECTLPPQVWITLHATGGFMVAGFYHLREQVRDKIVQLLQILCLLGRRLA